VTRATYVGPWRVDLTVRDGVEVPVAGSVLARSIGRGLDVAAEAGRAPSPASVGLILSDDVELADLNRIHMGKTGPTDVLSFPLLDPLTGTDAPAFALPPGRRPHLGDIVVSVERAIDQAIHGRGGQTGDVAWSPADEMRLLVTHGTLHICGWDHAEPAEERAMRALERRLLGVDRTG
jgi:probable rRNA maturation factor